MLAQYYLCSLIEGYMELERHLLPHGSGVGKWAVWLHKKFPGDHPPQSANRPVLSISFPSLSLHTSGERETLLLDLTIRRPEDEVNWMKIPLKVTVQD
jgi:hypothetical protein